MSDPAIRVEKLSKEYILGKTVSSDGLRHVIHALVTAPLRWLKNPAAALGRTLPSRNHSQTQGRKLPESFWALKNISFEVKPGEVVGIIGRNGAGKSTLLKILSRITEQTEGRVEITGRVASLLEVGTGFHPELTGRENIFLNGAILGMSRSEIRKKFDEIVAFAEVEKFLDTPVKRYSSGMYVRLAFAVAAHLEPEILIVDEVLAVGDAEFQKKCLGKMQDVSRGGRTVLFVSHNMAAVVSLCSRVIVLDAGTIAFDGGVEAGIAKYFKQQQLPKNHYLRKSPASNGSIQITEIELCNDDGHRMDIVDNGKPLLVRIHFRANDDVMDTIIPSLSVVDGNGVRLFQHHSRLNKKVFRNLPPAGMFTFRFLKVPLPASTYRFSAFLVSHERVVDRVEDAFEFSVFDGSYYPSGETTPASHGVTLVDGEWGLSTH